MSRICPYCKDPFIPKRIDAVYCCQSCRQMAYMERKTNLSVNINSLDGFKMSENQSETSAKLIYPSTDISEENKKPSIDALQQNIIEQPKTEEKYQRYESSFINELVELTNERNNVVKLYTLFIEDNSGAFQWVSSRFKCLAECLLTFSEMKTIEIDDLKDICNAFTMLIQSNYFKNLPQAYPYTHDILNLRESLKNICKNADENEPLKFRLQTQNKNKLIATRWELSHYVHKKTFSQLNFKD
jgi:hypothetical protein